ncbi:MAG TPA: hypothetical protein VGG15_09655 [Terriglobales bacterium]|jgi:hypothetical protein
MYRNVNLDAHLAALLFLGTAFLLLLLMLAALALYFCRRAWVRYSLFTAAVLVIAYGGMLLAFSAFSHDRTLPLGEEKYFCELDCHLAYSVQNVERAKKIGDAVANGEFYVVTVRGRFDETTTAPWRPRDAPVTPNALSFALVDGHGAAAAVSALGQKAWEANHGVSPSLLQALRPGESTEAVMVFDAGPAIRDPRLLASFAVFPTQLLIGDENSLLHKKTYFRF